MADTSAQHSGVAAGSARKGGNPNTDYKIRYLKCKDKFDRVSSDQTEIHASIAKATQKQRKLREEINFLLDAIGMKQSARAAAYEASLRPAYSPAPRDASLLYSSSAEPARDQGRSTRQGSAYASDEYAHRAGPSSRSRHHEYDAREASAPSSGYKRQRIPSDGPRDRRLDAAGYGGRPSASEDQGDWHTSAAEPRDEPAPKRPRNA